MIGFKEALVTRDIEVIRNFLLNLPEDSYIAFATEWVSILRDPEHSDYVKTTVRADADSAERIGNIILHEIDGKSVSSYVLNSAKA